ncbi:MAG: hypothetical protein FD167_4588 [bacterium]|nr:MAG: hypothetical protein FD167_4588 [bacterium]
MYIVASIKFRNKTLPFYVMILRVGAFKAEYLGKIVEICNSMRIIVRAMILDRGFYSGEVIDISNHINHSVSKCGLSITKPQKFPKNFCG